VHFCFPNGIRHVKRKFRSRRLRRISTQGPNFEHCKFGVLMPHFSQAWRAPLALLLVILLYAFWTAALFGDWFQGAASASGPSIHRR
jgi:hypothetical protein